MSVFELSHAHSVFYGISINFYSSKTSAAAINELQIRNQHQKYTKKMKKSCFRTLLNSSNTFFVRMHRSFLTLDTNDVLWLGYLNFSEIKQ